MANTIITTNRTIEVSVIDSDYMMPPKLNVQSVVFIPGPNIKWTDCVYIIESSPFTTDPIKCFLDSSIDGVEPRFWIFNQRSRLGFIFANGIFSTGSKVIFNIGELHYSSRITNVRINAWTPEMKMKLNQQTAIIIV